MDFKTREDFLDYLEDLPAPDPYAHLESEEAAAWFRMCPNNKTPFTDGLIDGLQAQDIYAQHAQKLNGLLDKLMCGPTLDDVAELRDVLRAVLIDNAKSEAKTAGLAYTMQRRNERARAMVARNFNFDDEYEPRTYMGVAS